MVTIKAVDFFHWRSTAGLSAQVRRIASRMRRKNFAKKFGKAFAELEEGIKIGRIELVRDTAKNILAFSEKENEYLYIIESDELKITFEEEKAEVQVIQLEQQLEKFLGSLGGTDPSAAQNFKKKIYDPLMAMCAAIRDETYRIRDTLAYLEADNVRGVSRKDFIMRFRTEKGLERRMRRLAIIEKRQVNKSKYGLNELYKELQNLNKLKSGDPLKKKVDALLKREMSLFKAMKEEIMDIYNIIVIATFLYVELLHLMHEKFPLQIKLLIDQRFLDNDLEDWKKDYESLSKQMEDHIRKIYGLSATLQRQAV